MDINALGSHVTDIGICGHGFLHEDLALSQVVCHAC